MTAVVGGASSGLGRACAHALAAHGHDLLLWSRRSEALDDAAEQVRGAVPGCEVRTLAADAGDPDAAAAVAEHCLEWFGGTDVLVLNAGGPPPCPPDATDADGWRAALQLLTVTPIDLATRLLPSMRQRGSGRIVAVLSSGVREPLPELCYSNGGRSALAAWLKTVAGVVAADGVTVNGVLPGRIATPRVDAIDAANAQRSGKDIDEIRAESRATIPAGRYGTADEFAAVVAFLASPEASYVTGTMINCDGGMARSML